MIYYALLHEECPHHDGHMRDPWMTPETCGRGIPISMAREKVYLGPPFKKKRNIDLMME